MAGQPLLPLLTRLKHDERSLVGDVVLAQPLTCLLGQFLSRARQRAGLPQVRVHDLKHTFGRRLRAAGVSFEDRQDLLGHRSGRITTHYSPAELQSLYQASESVCADDSRKSPALVLIK